MIMNKYVFTFTLEKEKKILFFFKDPDKICGLENTLPPPRPFMYYRSIRSGFFFFIYWSLSANRGTNPERK